MTLTFDLDADLVLVPPCDVADNTQVGSLVPNLNVLYLQSPVAVGLKTVSFKVPLPIFRPAEKQPETLMQLFSSRKKKYLPACSHHLSSGTGEPKNRQSKKVRLPSTTFMYSFLDPKIRGVESGKKKPPKTKTLVVICVILEFSDCFLVSHILDVWLRWEF